MIVTRALNYIHLIFLFAPFFLLFVNTKYLIKYSYILKYLFLIYLLTPLHWEFFNDRCIFTILSIKMGDYKDSDETIAFTDNNLRWLYEPFMKLIGLEWSEVQDVTYMIYLHWIVIFIVLWYIMCFKMCKK